MALEKRLAIGFLVGLVLTLGSLAFPHTATSPTDAREMRFGWPLWFVQQDVTAIDRPLPARIFIQSPWENPTDLRPLALLGSWMLLSLVGILVVEGVRKIV